MTDELLEKATHIRDKIENRRYYLEQIDAWEGKWHRMTQSRNIIPEGLQEDVTQYVTKVLKERYTKELESLEKEFAEL